MRIIIAGSRSINNYNTLKNVIKECPLTISEVVSGGARGVDRLGERWARDNQVNLHIMPAKWDKHGNSAGMIRNSQMADYADGLIALWDGESRGTKNMIETASKNGLCIFMYNKSKQSFWQNFSRV